MPTDERQCLRNLMHQTGALRVAFGGIEPEDFRIFHAVHGLAFWEFLNAIESNTRSDRA